MSGSNALAAAKRRRGGSDPRGPVPPGGQNDNQNGLRPVQAINPMQLIAINHQRLNKISEEIPKSVDALGESFNALSSNCDFLHDQFSVLEKQVSMLASNQSNQSNASFNSGVDSGKLNQLENDLVEVHKVIARMQSFSMDLSSELSKTKEQFDMHNSNVNLTLSQLNDKINTFEYQISSLQRIEQELFSTNHKLETLDEKWASLLQSNQIADKENDVPQFDISELGSQNGEETMI